MTKIYHNPRCSKSRAALDMLNQRDLNPEVILYLQDPPSVEQLQQLVAKSNASLLDLVRTNESIFTELNLAAASEAELYKAVAAHPILLNRPIVETAKGVRLGRPIEAIDDIL
ncbi:MAG TPA: arsenate reductase (glutaredoxin) [Paenalcaligenes hominis]|uniref:Arsenate reductase n=1 Tax=Paenalcaligenes hominis TaxID=643674 RepID=A0A9D2VG98_9BURK|nr:arsenate reductase (glutaredoxin) [Paenalcaligenes hominis]NJB64516.1 arsenate reductase [Paenalcaligenes hominis]HJH24268.1 arsenate reductase (glutaredoxin) [Paenalcaligenes hominis]